jgi:hypothetical protein
VTSGAKSCVYNEVFDAYEDFLADSEVVAPYDCINTSAQIGVAETTPVFASSLYHDARQSREPLEEQLRKSTKDRCLAPRQPHAEEAESSNSDQHGAGRRNLHKGSHCTIREEPHNGPACEVATADKLAEAKTIQGKVVGAGRRDGTSNLPLRPEGSGSRLEEGCPEDRSTHGSKSRRVDPDGAASTCIPQASRRERGVGSGVCQGPGLQVCESEGNSVHKVGDSCTPKDDGLQGQATPKAVQDSQFQPVSSPRFSRTRQHAWCMVALCGMPSTMATPQPTGAIHQGMSWCQPLQPEVAGRSEEYPADELLDWICMDNYWQTTESQSMWCKMVHEIEKVQATCVDAYSQFWSSFHDIIWNEDSCVGLCTVSEQDDLLENCLQLRNEAGLPMTHRICTFLAD